MGMQAAEVCGIFRHGALVGRHRPWQDAHLKTSPLRGGRSVPVALQHRGCFLPQEQEKSLDERQNIMGASFPLGAGGNRHLRTVMSSREPQSQAGGWEDSILQTLVGVPPGG